MLITKAFETQQHRLDPDDSELSLIQPYALRKLTEDDVWLGRCKLCNDQYDRAKERLTRAYLDRIAKTIIGRPVLENHDRDRFPLGRFYTANLAQEDGVTYVDAHYFLSRKNESLIGQVETGILKDVSISADIHENSRRCDLCNKTWNPKQREFCEHWPGKEYDGKTATITFDDDYAHAVEAREGSFVTFGCQYGAQTTAKSFDGRYFAMEWERGLLVPDHVRKLLQAGVPIWDEDDTPASAGKESDAMDLEKALVEIERLKAEMAETKPWVEAGKKYAAFLANDCKAQMELLSMRKGALVYVDIPDDPQAGDVTRLEKANKSLHDTVQKSLDPLPGGAESGPPPDEPVITRKFDPLRRLVGRV
jgi:hypothetical protein